MLIYLKVKPNQRFESVEKVSKGAVPGAVEWQIRLKAPAVDGQANENLMDFLSRVTGIPKSGISLKKGQTSRIKCVEIRADEQAVLACLENQAAGLRSKG